MSDKGRILVLTSTFPRWEGDSTPPFVMHLAKDLQQLGWSVDVLAPHASGAQKEGYLDGIHVERFQYFWPVQAQTLCYSGGALMNLAKNKSNYAQLPLLVAAQLLSALSRVTSRDYDLIHSHWILPQGFVGEAVASLGRIPHVITVHGSDILGLQAKWLKPFKTLTIEGAEAVTVNSEFTRQAVLELTKKVKHLRTIPMGVSESTPNPDRSADIRRTFKSSSDPLLIFVGRLVELKGVQDLLQAVARLKDEMPKTHALIIGEGPEEANLRHQAFELGIEAQVTFKGWIASDRVVDYLAASDIFVGASRQSRDGSAEAQGLAIIEAMLAGVPVIASRLGGIMESIEDEKSGLLVNEGSPSSIANAIRRLHSDNSLRIRIIQRAKETATTQFLREASARRFSNLFETILDDRR